jgi:hypothetical protein
VLPHQRQLRLHEVIAEWATILTQRQSVAKSTIGNVLGVRSNMIVRLIRVERDFRGNVLSKSEEHLRGDREKNPTRNYVGRLIARFHPELMSVDKVHLIDSSETEYRWYVISFQTGSNCWVTFYADPCEETPATPPAQA